MKKRRTRRAPSADWLAMTPADRAAVQQARFNNQSRRYHIDQAAITNGETTAKPSEPTK